MSDHRGEANGVDGGYSVPSFSYKPFVRMFYVSMLLQASLSYVFFSLGVLFSSNSFSKHLLGLYALFFGVVSFLYHLSIQSIVDRVHLFFPKFDEDIVKHTFYFLLGLPGLTHPYSFQLRLASSLFSIIGFVGTLVSFRHQNLLSTYFFRDPMPYQGF
ncbi:hypothetical protein MACJ_003737 [Theileria orientalis]|uniref:Uncharacterized protein n=1 Tax=Theileria orientalis TaxID=68886 RepID=A0A976SKH0_THEOR|nr:hypothetical protein MACJ_003737 [Theileria orientalis]